MRDDNRANSEILADPGEIIHDILMGDNQVPLGSK